MPPCLLLLLLLLFSSSLCSSSVVFSPSSIFLFSHLFLLLLCYAQSCAGRSPRLSQASDLDLHISEVQSSSYGKYLPDSCCCLSPCLVYLESCSLSSSHLTDSWDHTAGQMLGILNLSVDTLRQGLMRLCGLQSTEVVAPTTWPSRFEGHFTVTPQSQHDLEKNILQCFWLGQRFSLDPTGLVF